MADDEIRDKVAVLRKIAGPVGPLHPFWDVIFDAEALLAGRRTNLPRHEIEALLQKCTTSRIG